MYIEQDFVGPATLDLQANRRMHNRILRYWPTALVNGVEVMDRLVLYDGSVLDTDNHRKIYNILGMNVEDLQKENWEGVDSYWMYFDVVQGNYSNISNEELDDYIQFYAPFTVKSVPEAAENDRSEWITVNLSYEPLKVDANSNYLSNDEIINRIVSNPYIVQYSVQESHALTALVLLDTTGAVFERNLRVTYSGLAGTTFTSATTRDNTGTMLRKANIELKFRRKPESSPTAYTDYLDAVRDHIAGSVNVSYGSMYTQLHTMYNDIVPASDDEIIYTKTMFGSEEYGGSSTTAYYRKDGLQAMKSREFNKTILGRLKTDYAEEKADGWKTFVTILVAIVIIVIAVIAAIPTGGGSIAWGKAALVLTIGSLSMMGISIVLAKSDPAWAAYIGKASQTLGYLATAAGFTAMVQGFARTAAAGATATREAAKQSLIAAGKEVTEESIKTEALAVAGRMSFGEALKEITFESMGDMLVDMVKNSVSTTSNTMQSMLNAATKGFQLYAKYIAPPDDGLDDMTRQVEEQEKELEDLSSADLKDKIDYAFSSPYYNIYDFNEVMQAIPYSMTQGKIDETFNKYYDGVNSKVTYRGYLG